MKANPNTTRSIFVLLVTTLVFAATYSYVFDKKLDLNGDNANYYMLGKALATGEGYVNINNIQKRPNNHFPPGYPALISGIITVFGDSSTSIKLVNGVLFLLSLFGLYFLIKQINERESTAIIVILLIMFNSHLLRYSTMIMTEVPFLFFSIMALLAFTKINFNKPFWRDPWVYLSLLLLIIAFYIRTSGVALIGGIILYLLFTKRWQHATVIAIGIILLALPWQLRSHKLGGSSYAKQLVMVNPYRPEMGKASPGNYVDRFGNNVARYLTKEIPSATFSFFKPNYREPSSASQWLFGLPFFLIMIYGIWNLKKYKLLILAYLIGTFGILSQWPDVWVGVRFLLPAVPFLLIGLVNGLQIIFIRLIPEKAHKYLYWLPIIICLPFFSNVKPLHEQARTKIKANWANYFTLAKWVNDNLDANTVVACRKPTMFSLYSNSFAAKYKYTEDSQELIDNLIEKQVDYVVLEQLGYSSTARYLWPAIQNNPDKFKIIQKLNNPDTYLLQLIK